MFGKTMGHIREEGTKGLPCPAVEVLAGTQALVSLCVKGSDPIDEEKMSYCVQSIYAVCSACLMPSNILLVQWEANSEE